LYRGIYPPNNNVLTVADDILPHCFDFVVNHVFLPPQPPQHAEDHIDEGNAVLLQLLLHCADAYARQPPTGNFTNSQWYRAVKMLKSFVAFENKTLFSATVFASAVMGLKDSGSMHFSTFLIYDEANE